MPTFIGESTMRPDPYRCAVYLLMAFTLAGVAQTVWLRSRWSRRWARPIDGGRLWRGRRILGDHKTWKGFIVMVPATALSFFTVALFSDSLLTQSSSSKTATQGAPSLDVAAAGEIPDNVMGRWWSLNGWEYLALGAWAGVGFMVGELPNSFLKRRLNIGPGEAAGSWLGRAICTLADQIDSVIGALLTLACFVTVPWQTWMVLIVAGPLVHWLFNVVLWLLGVKRRAA